MLEMLEKLGKIGFVLPGGFMRGAFQVGALRAFYQKRVIPSYIVGTSAGAINGAAFAAGKMDTLYRVYQDIAEHPRRHVYRWNFYALLKVFFWSESLLANAPLYKTIVDDINMQDVIASPVHLDIITSDFQSGETVVFSNKNPEHSTTAVLSSALLASAAVPVIFPPVIYEGHQLFDGGVLVQAPLTYAIREGCDTIFIIANESIGTVERENLFRTIYSIGRRTMTLVEWVTTKRTIRRAQEINADVEEYGRLKRDVADRASAACKEKENEIRNSVAAAFSESKLSVNSQRRVAIHVLSPDILDAGVQSDRLLNYKIIPRFLERGERDATALLDRLEKNAHDHL